MTEMKNYIRIYIFLFLDRKKSYTYRKCIHKEEAEKMAVSVKKGENKEIKLIMMSYN